MARVSIEKGCFEVVLVGLLPDTPIWNGLVEYGDLEGDGVVWADELVEEEVCLEDVREGLEEGI